MRSSNAIGKRFVSQAKSLHYRQVVTEESNRALIPVLSSPFPLLLLPFRFRGGSTVSRSNCLIVELTLRMFIRARSRKFVERYRFQ